MFGENKKKMDSRVRFQNTRFRQKLQAQRSYKRPLRRLPQTPAAVFLAKIGLGSYLARILTAAVFFALVYVVFIPNIFFVKHITVNGAGVDGPAAVEATIGGFLDKKLPWPQKNLLLLSKTGLAGYLLSHNQKILSVDKVSKKLPNTLIVDITPRQDAFVLQTLLGSYSVSQDGLVTNEFTDVASGSLPSALALIKLTSSESFGIGQQVFTAQNAQALDLLKKGLPSAMFEAPDYYQLNDSQSQDIGAHFKEGFKMMFDLSSDINETLARLKVLLSQIQPGDVKRLFYIDMRIQDKGYVCYQGDPCVQDIHLPNDSATGTIPSLGN